MSTIAEQLCQITGPSIEVGRALAVFEATGNAAPLRAVLAHIAEACTDAATILDRLDDRPTATVTHLPDRNQEPTP